MFSQDNTKQQNQLLKSYIITISSYHNTILSSNFISPLPYLLFSHLSHNQYLVQINFSHFHKIASYIELNEFKLASSLALIINSRLSIMGKIFSQLPSESMNSSIFNSDQIQSSQQTFQSGYFGFLKNPYQVIERNLGKDSSLNNITVTLCGDIDKQMITVNKNLDLSNLRNILQLPEECRFCINSQHELLPVVKKFEVKFKLKDIVLNPQKSKKYIKVVKMDIYSFDEMLSHTSTNSKHSITARSVQAIKYLDSPLVLNREGMPKLVIKAPLNCYLKTLREYLNLRDYEEFHIKFNNEEMGVDRNSEQSTQILDILIQGQIKIKLMRHFNQNGIYVGEFVNGKREGYGREEFYKQNQIKKYVGLWKNDIMNGEGKIVYKSGETYKGRWKDGKIYQGSRERNILCERQDNFQSGPRYRMNETNKK